MFQDLERESRGSPFWQSAGLTTSTFQKNDFLADYRIEKVGLGAAATDRSNAPD